MIWGTARFFAESLQEAAVACWEQPNKLTLLGCGCIVLGPSLCGGGYVWAEPCAFNLAQRCWPNPFSALPDCRNLHLFGSSGPSSDTPMQGVASNLIPPQPGEGDWRAEVGHYLASEAPSLGQLLGLACVGLLLVGCARLATPRRRPSPRPVEPNPAPNPEPCQALVFKPDQQPGFEGKPVLERGQLPSLERSQCSAFTSEPQPPREGPAAEPSVLEHGAGSYSSFHPWGGGPQSTLERARIELGAEELVSPDWGPGELAAAVEALDHFAFMPDSALIGGAGSVPSNLVLPTDVASELGAIQSPDAGGGGGLDFWGSFINF